MSVVSCPLTQYLRLTVKILLIEAAHDDAQQSVAVFNRPRGCRSFNGVPNFTIFSSVEGKVIKTRMKALNRKHRIFTAYSGCHDDNGRGEDPMHAQP